MAMRNLVADMEQYCGVARVVVLHIHTAPNLLYLQAIAL